jgi:aspartate carbamoyltransferase regulatory subunit
MLTVEPIDKGTVIDHIQAGRGKKVMQLLGIREDYKGKVALVMNVPSKTMGKKDILKIADRIIEGKLANLVALVAPHSSINIIRGGKVAKKYNVELPNTLEGIGVCPNPNCISNTETVDGKFERHDEAYRCHYCERVFDAQELAK